MAYHEPVLLDESMDGLQVKPDGIYVDATFGGGGHSLAILQHLKKGRLLAFDQDEQAGANAIKDKRFTFIRGNFRFMKNFLRYHGVEKIDGVLGDLGVSSHHFDEAERGFSFRFPAPLDMRMNQHSNLPAGMLVNEYPEEKLVKIFREYGELKKEARKVTKRIMETRNTKSIETTSDLTDALSGIIPVKQENKFLAKVFQALRIEVNAELESLEKLLDQATQFLNPGGRMVFITYHSLEDRMVKNFFKSGNFSGAQEKDLFGNVLAPLQPVNRGVITPGKKELEKNPRSRSAKLRIAEKKEH
jgi:16S rRNA (cytosine1402-N4)-methyltransferase